MTVQEIYNESSEFPSLKLLIDYLVNEKKVLKMTDNEEKLTYFLQEKFHKKLNEYLSEYEVKRNG
jgi:hypothetical protein